MSFHLRLDEVDSTNTYAKQHFRELGDASVVSAVRQTSGRGRVGRKWLSADGLDITASFVFQKLDQPFYAGVITGVAAIELLREHAPEAAAFLKWPNDIYVNCAKLSGMLSEAVWEQGRMQCAVCGIGLNVNSDLSMLHGAGQPAVSLYTLTGRKFNVKFLIDALAKIVNKYYIIYQQYPQDVFARWREYNRLIGHRISIVDPAGKCMSGIFRDVSADGAMIFETGGNVTSFSCGDVKLDPSSWDMQC